MLLSVQLYLTKIQPVMHKNDIICNVKDSFKPFLLCKKSASSSDPEQVQLPSEMAVDVVTAATFTKARKETKSKECREKN